MSRTFPPSRGCECWSYPGWDPEFAIRFSSAQKMWIFFIQQSDGKTWKDLEWGDASICFFKDPAGQKVMVHTMLPSLQILRWSDTQLPEVLTPHGLLSCPQERDETWKPMKRKGFSWQGAIEVFVWTWKNMAALGYIWHLYAVFTYIYLFWT